MLNKRQEKLIRILDEAGDFVMGKELSALLEVSDRTVRSDVAAVNEFYGERRIEADKRRGYKSNQELAHVQSPKSDGKIPESSKERCSYILQALLFNKKEINLITLQEQLYTSDYSIENDIRKIRKFLEEWPDLELIRTPNHLRLGGSEKNKRKLYRELLTKETEGNFLNLNNLASLYGRFNLLEVKQILDSVFEKYEYQIREVAVPMLMLHIGVSVERILDENYVNTDMGYEVAQERKEFAIASEFFDRISRRFHVPVVRDEVVLLALFLMERSGSRHETEEGDFAWLLEDILESIYQTFGVDFREDPELKRGLGIHIRYMLDRILQAGCISNVCLEEIKSKYPLVFEMGCYVSSIIEHRMQLSVNENEIGFIALHLGCAYERMNHNEKYRAVIICPYNQGLLSLCSDKMKQLFGERMEIVDIMTLFERSAVAAHAPDLLITTFPLKHGLKIPTVQISLLMNQDDESRIFQTLNMLDGQRFKNQNLPRIISLIRPETFYTNQEFKRPEEVIGFLCDCLDEDHYLPEGFKDSVLVREQLSATSFSYGFAIPHSLNIPSCRSVFPVMLLKKPVRWGDYEVKMVILLAIAEEDREMMRIFFDWMGNMAGDPGKLSRLMESKDREAFVKILMEM